MPRGIAFHTDLYTAAQGGAESDDFEHWLEREFEAPARKAIERVLRDQTLGPQHWQHLGRYALCQQMRTPQHFEESMRRWEETLPGVMRDSIERSVAKLEALRAQGIRAGDRQQARGPAAHLDDTFRIIIRPDAHPETNQGEVGVEMLLGRELWLKEQRHVLEGVGWISARHSWSIAEPADGGVWFTSDQPVARVNYGKNGMDLKGGWGRMHGNILMPLSPRHLLFTQIGEDLPPRIRLGKQETRIIVEALAQRAHRVVFARRPIKLVEWLRPRRVDAAAYQRQSLMWKDWHAQQTSAQNEYERG